MLVKVCLLVTRYRPDNSMRTYTKAILCTIHQPSALLFESFGGCDSKFIEAIAWVDLPPTDRLLLLESGGETVYFGDIGRDSKLLREYFARHGAVCPQDVNPAE